MVRWSSSIRSSSRSRFHNRIKLSIFHGFGENKIMCSTEPSPGASGYASCIYPHYYKTSPSTISLMLNVAWRGTWKTTTASNLNIRKYSNFIEFTRLNLPWVLRDENAVKNTIDTGEGSAVKIVSEKKEKKNCFVTPIHLHRMNLSIYFLSAEFQIFLVPCILCFIVGRFIRFSLDSLNLKWEFTEMNWKAHGIWEILTNGVNLLEKNKFYLLKSKGDHFCKKSNFNYRKIFYNFIRKEFLKFV